MVRMERVKKSSGGIDVRLRLESDRAAFRSARRDAVKLDLKAERSGCKRASVVFARGSADDDWKTRKSRLSILVSASLSLLSELSADRGSALHSPGGDETGVMDRRVGRTFRTLL